MQCHFAMTTTFTYEAYPAPPYAKATLATSNHPNYATMKYIDFVVGTKPTYNTRTNIVN